MHQACRLLSQQACCLHCRICNNNEQNNNLTIWRWNLKSGFKSQLTCVWQMDIQWSNPLEQTKADISHWIEEYYGSVREKLLSEAMKDIPECCTVVLVILIAHPSRPYLQLGGSRLATVGFWYLTTIASNTSCGEKWFQGLSPLVIWIMLWANA